MRTLPLFPWSVLVVTLVYSGYSQTDDWPMFGHDARHSNASQTVIRPPLKLTATLSIPDGYLYSSGIYPPDLVTKSGKIFFAYSPAKISVDFVRYDQEIICLDEITGKSLWSRRREGIGNEWFSVAFGSPNPSFPSVDLIAAESLYLASQRNGFVAALNEIDGSDVWRSRDEQVDGPQWMVFAGDKLIVRSYGSIAAFTTSDGTLLWRLAIRNSSYPSMPLFADDRILFTSAGKLYAANPATGELYWTNSIPENGTIHLASASLVFVAATDSNFNPRRATISAFDISSGRKVWNAELVDVALVDIAASDKHILAQTFDASAMHSTLTCLDAKTGIKNWELRFVNTRPRSMVLAGDKYLYVHLSSADPERIASLNALDVSTGKIVWQETFVITPYIYPTSYSLPLGAQTNYSRLKISNGKLLLLGSTTTDARQLGVRYVNTLYVYEGASANSIPDTLLLGRVSDFDTSAVLLGIAVEALQSGGIKGRALTDAAGGYRISGLPAGTYDLRVSGANHATTTVSGVQLNFGDSVAMDFSLHLLKPVTRLADNLLGPGPLTIQGDNVFWLETSTVSPLSELQEVRIQKTAKSGGSVTTMARIPIGNAGGDGGNAIQCDTTFLYLSINRGYGDGAIYQMPLPGGTTLRLTSANQPRNLQIDDNFIYWAESNGGPPDLTGIRRISKQGGAVTTISTIGYEYALTLDAKNVYFGVLEGRFTSEPYRTTLNRTAQNGGASTILASADYPNWNSANSINTIAVADGKVYWGGSKGGIKTVPVTGGPVTVLVDGQNQISNLIFDKDQLYWIEADTGGSRWIKSLVLSTGTSDLIATGRFNNLISDGDFLYATIGTPWLPDGMLLKFGKRGLSEPTVITGRVIDQATDTGLVGATVQVLENGQIKSRSLTDSSGNYRLENLASGTYEFRASKEEFLAELKFVRLRPNQSERIDFALAVAPSFNELLPRIGPGNVPHPENPVSRYVSIPAKQQSKDGLIVVTHGWQISGSNTDPSWLDEMSNAIKKVITDDWDVIGYNWAEHASGTPGRAKTRGEEEGRYLGRVLSNEGWKHIHFIAHSAGAALIEAASETIKARSKATVIHCTFLDPYVGVLKNGRTGYGFHCDWADHYFSKDIFDRLESPLLEPALTEGPLENAFNVDVTWLDDNKRVTPFYCSSPSSTPATLDPCGFQALSTHKWPRLFYRATIPPGTVRDSAGFGFPLSKEGGGWNITTNTYRVGNPSPRVLGGQDMVPRLVLPVRKDENLLLNSLPNLRSNSGDIRLFDNHLILSVGTSLKPQSLRKDPTGGLPTVSNLTSDATAWIAFGTRVTNTVNFVTFAAEFFSPANAAGLLNVYWNTNEIGSIDQKTVLPGIQPYSFELPASYFTGHFVLGFRLDSFTNIISSVVVTNIALGYFGPSSTAALTISRDKTVTTVGLESAPGYSYMLQSSSDLNDWVPLAILGNTNGVAYFTERVATNGPHRFYRAERR